MWFKRTFNWLEVLLIAIIAGAAGGGVVAIFCTATYQMQTTAVVKILDSRPTLSAETPEGDEMVVEEGDEQTKNNITGAITRRVAITRMGVLVLAAVVTAVITIRLSRPVKEWP